ncbi:hypothetical protein COLO4_37112 [Corchorus olitorius]|uniref:Uncharacterized protein n=1 Tax=Corchorus olitorius TaxID=93759 RepID=A0A1R3G3C4_9ROSI|nr:hypothetical protein COLO4_37112 [Corchorus olitorius]
MGGNLQVNGDKQFRGTRLTAATFQAFNDTVFAGIHEEYHLENVA